MAELLAARNWRQAEIEAMEAREQAIDGALLALSALDGMFIDRPEIRDILKNGYDLLTVEAENLRTAASRARIEP